MGTDVRMMKHTGQKDTQVRSGLAGSTVLLLSILLFTLVVAPVSAATLATPVMVSPTNNQHFFHYPRITTLACKPVSGASGYLFEWEYYDVQWEPREQVTMLDPYFTFNFIGDQPGRWRVTAVDLSGKKDPSKASAWRTFDYCTSHFQLATPVMVSPATGAVFYHFPRETTVSWKPMPGADSYKVQVQYYDRTARRWYDDTGSPADISGQPTASYTFLFGYKTQGRWRVQATDSTNTFTGSEWSTWRTFRFVV